MEGIGRKGQHQRDLKRDRGDRMVVGGQETRCVELLTLVTNSLPSDLIVLVVGMNVFERGWWES